MARLLKVQQQNQKLSKIKKKKIINTISNTHIDSPTCVLQ